MLSILTHNKQSLIGLEIHPDEIRLVQIKRLKSQLQIERFALIDLPEGSIVDGKIKKFEAVVSAIKELVALTNAHGLSAAVALPANSVINKRIKLAPNLTMAECETEIAENLSRYFPGLADKLCFDFVVLKKQEAEYQDVLLVAARQEQLDEYVQVVEQAKLRVTVVDMDILALIRGASLCSREITQQKTIAILVINARSAQFVVAQNQEIVFNHALYFPTDMDDFSQELKRTIQLYASTNREMPFSELLLAGKTNTICELEQQIKHELSLKIKIADPCATLMRSSSINEEELKHAASSMLTCCGLSLRGALAW